MRTSIRYGCIGVLFIAMATAGRAQDKTLVERLGYPREAKLLIVHADDMGMSHNVNVATLDVMKNGWVSSASIMVPCPWFPEAAAMAKENPDLDLGIHLTLNAEWRHYRWGPVASRSLVPGLLDKEGFLPRSVRGALGRATAEEVETEIRAQVQRAIDFGIQPTHIDSHMGTLFARPDFFEAYRKVAHEFKVPFLLPRPTPEMLAVYDPEGRMYSPEKLTAIETSGDIMIDHLVTDIPASAEERTEGYVELAKRLKPGVTELIIHCGGDTDELRAITGSWATRVADARAFRDPAVKKALDEAGVKLIGWAAIKNLQYGEPR
jgi:predicted glycoside hydrolase/deacetylase ChbG (UPF0249 family)